MPTTATPNGELFGRVPRPVEVFTDPARVRCLGPCQQHITQVTFGEGFGQNFVTCTNRFRPAAQPLIRSCGQKLFLLAAPGGRIVVIGISSKEFEQVRLRGDAGIQAQWELGIFQAAFAALAKGAA